LRQLAATPTVDTVLGIGLGLRFTDFSRSSASTTNFFVLPTAMPPSASKQKRLAEKAAKQAAKANANATDLSVSSSTPPGSNGGSSLNTPLTSLSAATSQEDLTSMAKLQIATERLISLNSLSQCIFPILFLLRSTAGVLVSDPKGRDIKIDAYTLSFHGRLLIEGAEIALNYGQRYGLLGENGSGKVCSNRRWSSLVTIV
jgi:ATP-binding cassette, subfamily F, member 2